MIFSQEYRGNRDERHKERSQMFGRETGDETAIHARWKIFFGRDQSGAVILVDAAISFNSVNRKVLLYYISIKCPPITIYVKNCYKTLARLFVSLRAKKFTVKTRHDTRWSPLRKWLSTRWPYPLFLIYWSKQLQITWGENNRWRRTTSRGGGKQGSTSKNCDNTTTSSILLQLRWRVWAQTYLFPPNQIYWMETQETPHRACLLRGKNSTLVTPCLARNKEDVVPIYDTNELRDITAFKRNLPDVKTEPTHWLKSTKSIWERELPTTREKLANTRLDINALGFWRPGQEYSFYLGFLT